MEQDPDFDSLDSLRQSIDALALEVALRDLGSAEGIRPLAPMLSEIRCQAEAAGMIAVATAAAGTPDDGPAFQDVVSRMQQLLAEPQARPTAPREMPQEAPPPPAASLNQDPELVGDFIMESREHLSGIESQLLALEQDPRNAEAVNTIFRGFHTIKGLAGFLEFPAIQRFAHEVETLLDLARNLKLPVDSVLIDIILQSADHMNQCLLGVEKGVDQASDSAPLIARIRNMIGCAPGAKIEAPPAPPADAPAPASSASLAVAQLAAAVAEPDHAAAAGSALPAQDAGIASRSVKVDTGKLDYLVEMVGELVIAQSLIQQDADIATVRSPRLTRNLGQLTRITSDVQRVAMAMRMIPIGQLFGRMARLVRDLARKSGKQANLNLTGEDTELDRNMVEELADPLMHMIRNAVDHGAELPEARIAAGKSPVASLDLKAYHKGGFINIEISDDGRGLIRDKILAKARERGLVSGGDSLSDQEVFSFIFEPGFSTAEKITDVSGRGVGMDVVRKQIVKLRGRVDISSVPGHGTTFTMKLPLTMAIIEGLVVGVGVQRYIIPIFAVKEMFRPTPAALSSVPDGGEMVLVRGSLLPILRLYKSFAVTPGSEEPSNGVLIVVESARTNYCIQVDELFGKREVVIKSLGDAFKNVTGIAGGSILGDGRVGLILDVEALFGNPTRE
ncbi:MAG TPA: chemotaxis protein CheA [Bryobacteraceae bacterium]|jgi:two-component system chemotaxis sensor kinase CheA